MPAPTRWAAGAEVDVVHEQGMFHVWPLFDMPESRRARQHIVAFLNESPSPIRQDRKTRFEAPSAEAAE